MSRKVQRIGIIGAGAWGSALATVARRAGREVVIWAFEPETAEAINRHGENTVFLPGVKLDPQIRATTTLGEAADADAVMLVTPAQNLRAITEKLSGHWKEDVPAVVCAKGIEQKSGKLMSEVVSETLPGAPVAVLSGPTFAAEVAEDRPTAVTLACRDADVGKSLVVALGTHHFRPYLSEDVIAAEIGGAVKNVLAIGSGIVIGRGLGENSRAALITRGLAEMVRLGVAKGGRAVSMMGLSGFGDLCLTCNSGKSRNMSLGIQLGQGKRLSDILAARKSVAEGVFTASSVVALARELGVELPICGALDQVLNHGADIDTTIAELLSRPFTLESDRDGMHPGPL